MIRLDKVIRLYTVIFVACLLMVLVMSASAAPTKITFMFRGGTSQEELVNKWITDFEEKNQDIKVEWMVAGNDITQKLPVLMSTGIGPDVFEMWGVSPREWAEKGMLLDLAPYVKRDFKQADAKDFFR